MTERERELIEAVVRERARAHWAGDYEDPNVWGFDDTAPEEQAEYISAARAELVAEGVLSSAETSKGEARN
jgi:hypothetical protein